MDNRMDQLWRGGQWEQPAPHFPTPPNVVIPKPTAAYARPRLPTRRRRRWPAFVGLLSLILVVTLSAILLKPLLERPIGQISPNLPDYFSQPEEESYSTEPPTIPQAPTGTGVTLPLLSEGGQGLNYTQIYEKNLPSIVSIQSENDREYSTGTGVVLTQDGYIVTNAHVVAGASDVQVVFSDNSVLDASLVGFDPEEDLAVLKVEADNLIPAEFGDSSQLRIGQSVAAIGDPLGYRSTITDGIISSLDREVDVEGITMILIQTSAAINFGNSGGALINEYGQVVGITTIKIVTDDGSAEALGFAIPSQRVKYVVDTLIDGGEIQTGVFGFTVLTRPVSGGGLELQSIDPRSDAHAKGLQPGDVIISANGNAVTGTQDLARLKLSLGPGDAVTLVLLRNGEPYTVQVTLMDATLMNEKSQTP